MPAEWQAAIAWAGVLIDLPFAQYLARGGATYAVDGRRPGVP